MKKRSMGYREYITVDVKDPQFKAEIEKVLEQLAQTPEGQEVLQRAKLFNGGQPLRIEEGTKAEAHVGSGVITFNRDDLATTQFGAADGGLLQASLNRAVFHEIFHMADQDQFEFHNASPAEKQRLTMSVVDEALAAFIKQEIQLVDKNGEPIDADALSLDQKFWALEKIEEQTPGSIDYFTEKFAKGFMPHEKSAVAATNEFMSKYYGEEDRATYGASRKGTQKLEVHDDFLSKPEASTAPPPINTPMP